MKKQILIPLRSDNLIVLSNRIFAQHIMVNDALPNRILSGTVVVKGNIKRFTENGIVFEGESKETAVDDVILATGYQIKFPFFDENVGNRFLFGLLAFVFCFKQFSIQQSGSKN